jgi:hypothetical protein
MPTGLRISTGTARDGGHWKLKIRDLKIAIANPKFKVQNSKHKNSKSKICPKYNIQVQQLKFKIQD